MQSVISSERVYLNKSFPINNGTALLHTTSVNQAMHTPKIYTEPFFGFGNALFVMSVILTNVPVLTHTAPAVVIILGEYLLLLAHPFQPAPDTVI